MNQQLIDLIDLCLIDGIITDKEREVIFRKAKELGVPQDECEIIVDAMLYQKSQSLTSGGEKAPDVKEPGSGRPEIEGQVTPSDKDTTIDFRESLKQIDESVKNIESSEFITLISQDTLISSWSEVKSNHLSDLFKLNKGSSVIVQSIASGFDPRVKKEVFFNWQEEFIMVEELTEKSQIEIFKDLSGELKWGEKSATIKSIRPHPLNVIYKYQENGFESSVSHGVLSRAYLSGSILGRNLKFFKGTQFDSQGRYLGFDGLEKFRTCILPNIYLSKAGPERILISKPIEGWDKAENGEGKCVDKQLAIMYWKESFLGIYIEYIFRDEVVRHEKGLFGIDDISVDSDSWGKYIFSHISVRHDFLGLGDSLLDIYTARERTPPSKTELASSTPEKREAQEMTNRLAKRDSERLKENLTRFSTKDNKSRLYLMNIKTPTFESFFQTYSEDLRSNKLLFDAELKDALNNLNQIQTNLRNAFANKSFGYELIKRDLYNLIRNTSEFIPKLNPLVNELIELPFESVFDLTKYENSILLRYDHFLSSFEKVLQHQYLINNMLDNFSTKETEQKYMMFKSDIEKSGLFFTTYENTTIEILNNINISISDLRNTVEYYGQQQIRMMEQMNAHLQNIDHNAQKMVGSLSQLVKNTGATNFILALQFIQDYRRNKILRRIEGEG